MRKIFFIPIIILFVLLSTGCSAVKNADIVMVDQQGEVSQNDNNKIVTWCDKRTMEDLNEPFHEGKLWISSEYFNGMSHGPTIRHFCHENREIFTLEMEWNDEALVHTGKLISHASNTSLSINSNNKDPEVKLIEERNKKDYNQVWFTLDGKVFLFDQSTNKFIENPKI